MRNPCTATKSSPGSLQFEKAHVQQQRPNAAKKKGREGSREKKEERRRRDGGARGRERNFPELKEMSFQSSK